MSTITTSVVLTDSAGDRVGVQSRDATIDETEVWSFNFNDGDYRVWCSTEDLRSFAYHILDLVGEDED